MYQADADTLGEAFNVKYINRQAKYINRQAKVFVKLPYRK